MAKNFPTIILGITPFFPCKKQISIEKEQSINSVSLSKESFGNNILLVFLKEKVDKNLDIYSINHIEKIGLLTNIEQNFSDIQNLVTLNINSTNRVNIKSITFDTNTNCYIADYEKIQEEIIGENTQLIWLNTIKENIELIKIYSSEYYNNIKKILDNDSSFEEKIFYICNKFLVNIRDIYNKSTLEIVEYTLNNIIDLINTIKFKIIIEEKTKQRINNKNYELWVKEQINTLQDENTSGSGNLKNKILKSKIPKHIKKIALEEYNKFSEMPSSSSESALTKQYIKWILEVPWNRLHKSELSIENAKKILDQHHYGMEEVKERILGILAVMKNKPDFTPRPVLLIGAPGVGKSTFCKSIAEALFGVKIEPKTKEKIYNLVRISLAGMSDSARLKGHSRTYVGSMPGEIVRRLKANKFINPVFLLDEIDKCGSGGDKDPMSVLLELLDPVFNKEFHDVYLDIPLDLSKALFVATANSIDRVPPAILNRFLIIKIPSYSDKEKLEICKSHIIPEQLEAHGVSSLTFSDDAIRTIISEYTMEAGVRRLSTRISEIISNTLIKPENKISEINAQNVHDLLKRKINQDKSIKPEIGLIHGLYYSESGGGTMQIEATIFPSEKENISICGCMKDSMRESVHNAIAFIKSLAKHIDIPVDFFTKKTIHINTWGAATPKDGPSAGVAITTAIMSLVLSLPIPNNIGVTGEISIKGRSLLVGGLKEKITGAKRYGLSEVFIPYQTPEIELPKDVDIKITRVFHIFELWQSIWPDSPEIRKLVEVFKNDMVRV